MLKNSMLSAALAALLSAAGPAAMADTLYSAGATGALATPDAAPAASFSALAGAGSLSLQLQGYATLDGDHFYIDILHITLNGTEVFTATFDLGGGGLDRVLLSPLGATAVKDSSTHTVDIVVPLSLAGGSNTLVIAYDSPTSFESVGRAGPQGLDDEGWGLNSVTVTGAVPEPATALLMFGGLGLVGWLARRRSRA
ncbi:PEP-CTERM sorting domain-containing protein [Aquabacterium sp.]|uniref:PEP-CTERM sorting domain-containing protein n=1 Tax=Aquabacterium sp. TaxID=1872578 RepID=UPI002BC7D6D7|nr:PEP-CTERM sorting domain-containing protein [Aquabacterium sp.]HSW07936.1 PEP-CTERM sorting domain-containing protein [Aquabacterium sp.]